MTRVSILSFDPAAVNCGIIVGTDRSLLVDAGPGPAAAAHLVERAGRLGEEIGGSRPRAIELAITHDHWDHFFGAAAAVSAGVTAVYASSSFAADQEATAWIALDGVADGDFPDEYRSSLPTDPGELIVDVAPVDPTPGDVWHLDLGGCPVEFHVLGGHSTADLVVRLPELGIVFTGDLVEEADAPQAGADASLSEWASSLHTLLSFPEAKTFVPGHGVPVDRDFVSRQLADIEGMRVDQGDAEVALPARSMPGDHDRTIPREHRLV
ncbi:MBL fold metallo-hydrolase [Brevibacterium permense]|uniref:MBL fold metallo-hydrolase n=1 Tax=Brevibacterium permense TaxID=234834 RepID=UPI001564CD50|nr:MBL fold metallo-hydrolase [Brevibacterium permense]